MQESAQNGHQVMTQLHRGAMGESELSNLDDEAVEAGSHILSEYQCRLMGRSEHFFLYDEEVGQVPSRLLRLRANLLHTAKSPHLSLDHAAAALNALCRFLEDCRSSGTQTQSSLCYSSSTCKDVIFVLLDRSDVFKAKVAKQLLVTLSNILVAYPDVLVRDLLIRHLVGRCVRSLKKQEDVKSIKHCINILEYLMKRNVVTASVIVCADTKAVSLPGRSGHELLLEEPLSNVRVVIEEFITHVLDWVRYPDCASAISRFLPSFLTSLDISLAASLSEEMVAQLATEVPFWIEPIRRSLRRDLSNLDSFEIAVLPRLLCLSSRDRKSFLETLSLGDLRTGYTGRQSDSDIHLCLLATRVMNANPNLLGKTSLQAHLLSTKTDR